MSITSITGRNFSLASTATSRSVGPGTYDIERSRTPSESNYPFGSTTRRDLWNIPDEPFVGPGSYDIAAAVPSSRYSSLGTNLKNREYFVDHQQTPSPADHAPLRDWVPKRKRATSSTRPRRNARPPQQPKAEEQTPGPGAYNVSPPKKKARRGLFSASRVPQREPARDNGIPGPADYTITGTRIPTTASPAFRGKQRGEVFGPGAEYDATTLNHRAWEPELHPGRPFGSNTTRQLDWHIVETPGPGTYIGQETRVFTESKRPFGASRRETVDPDAPGPGYYRPSSARRATREKSGPRAARGELFEVVDTPGPGRYDTDTATRVATKRKNRIKSPAFASPASERDVLTNREPGPGPAYCIRPSSARGVREIAKAPRVRQTEYIGGLATSDGPSPDAYSPAPSTPRRNATIPRANRKPPVDDRPAAYQAPSSLIKPSYNVRFDPELKKHQKFIVY